MKNLKSTDGTHYLDCVTIDYSKLVKTFGEPNAETDDYKTDAEWHITTPHGIGTIYNYKNGRNYLGKEGTETEEITNWHIGGHNSETAEWIKKQL